MKTRRFEALRFVLPSVLVVLLIAFWPLLRTFTFAFTNAKLGTLDNPAWVGLANFRALLADPIFWGSVKNTVIFTVCSVSLETVLGLGIALLLNESFKGRGLVRTAILIPWAIPTVVSARLWAWMFNDLYGVINAMLMKWHWIDAPIAWLANPKLALFTVVFVDVWKATPFMTLLLLAGLQSIPRSLFEAARIEGASGWRQFRKITLPLLRPALLIAVIFRTLDALRVFDLPYILTSNTGSTRVMSVFARQQLIDFQDVGYGSAASFMVFAVIAVFTVIYLVLGRKDMGLDR